MDTLLERLRRLIERWESRPYTGDLTKAAYAVAAKELREAIERPSVPESDAVGEGCKECLIVFSDECGPGACPYWPPASAMATPANLVTRKEGGEQ